MGQSEREIEVRCLTGESIILSISPDKTIRDLKLLLTESFLPASSSSNFHLFFKGVKLGLQSQVSSHSVQSGEFLVLVPYTKKDRQQTLQDDKSTTRLNDLSECSTSKAADLAWSDMIHELSFLRSISETGNQSSFETKNKSFNPLDSKEAGRVSPVNRSSADKRKKRSNCDTQEGHMDALIISILQSSENAQLDQQNCKILTQVLESVTCLSNSRTGNCMLKEAFSRDSNLDLYANNITSCICPSWLKTIMKAFYFLNIYSSRLQLQQEKVTATCLKEALDQLGLYGLKVGIADLEHLSVLCPEVVRFVDDEISDADSLNALLIINSSVQQRQHESASNIASRKHASVTKIVNAMKKREGYFRRSLNSAVKLLMCKNGNEKAELLSLEDLLMFVKQTGSAATGNGEKRARRTRPAASSSHSRQVQTRCHEKNSLLPVEMIEHLRGSIGSSGQMVHVEEISARVANHVEIPNELSENMKSALKRIGITRLYSHQAESVRASLAGKNVVVATMTSSGKSLCYNLPVLEILSQNLDACALYLFPTKALAQDQLRALLTMAQGFDRSLNIGIYDGDTSQTDRIWLRDNARLLITNPDMLHMSILPFHGQFRRLLSNLSQVYCH
ncbi:DNA helicase [Bertholletia excelsa]